MRKIFLTLAFLLLVVGWFAKPNQVYSQACESVVVDLYHCSYEGLSCVYVWDGQQSKPCNSFTCKTIELVCSSDDESKCTSKTPPDCDLELFECSQASCSGGGGGGGSCEPGYECKAEQGCSAQNTDGSCGSGKVCCKTGGGGDSCTLTLTPATASIAPTGSVSFTAVPNPNFQQQGLGDDYVEFLTSDSNIATLTSTSDSSSPFNSQGLGVAAGTATITARYRLVGREAIYCTDQSTVTVESSVGDISGTVYLLGDGATTYMPGGYCAIESGSASALNLGTNVTVNPDGYTGTVGGGGNYTVSNVPSRAGYWVTLDPATYTCACPAGTCQYGGISSPQAGVDYYLSNLAYAWWQAEGGNIHADSGSVSSNIPPSCSGAGCDPYLITEAASGTTGLVSYTGSLVTGSGDISQDGNDWQAKTKYKSLTTGYPYFKRILEDDPADSLTWDGSEPGASGVYTAAGSVGTFGGDWSIASGTAVVLLVDGDVSVNGNINVDSGGFLAVIASGNISVHSSVTNVEGVYIADGTIATGTTGTGDEQLTAEGMFTGWSGFSLDRDLAAGNNNQAAEYFVYRPDLQINAYRYLTRSKYRWQEVAP